MGPQGPAEIGVDAARWFFASRGPSSAIDFDIELAKKQSNRTRSTTSNTPMPGSPRSCAGHQDVGLVPVGALDPADLEGGPEAALVREIVRLPEVVEDAAAAEEAQGVTAYATELASTFHAFYRDAKVVDPADPARSTARLALVAATKTTLANALGLLGISAPEQM